VFQTILITKLFMGRVLLKTSYAL